MKKPDQNHIADIFALTPMQEGMLFHYLKEPGSDYYIEQLSLHISGEVDKTAFKGAWEAVVRANEMLRTVFRWEKAKNPVQIVLKEHTPTISFYDLSPGKDTGKYNSAQKIESHERLGVTDLQDVPFKIACCKLDNDSYRLIITNHHILYDGWSNGIILKEFFREYHGLLKGETPATPVKEKVQFKAFVKRLQGREKDSARRERYWKEYLAGFDTRTQLPVTRGNGNRTATTQTHRTGLGPEVSNGLEDLVKAGKLTVASVLYSAWGILLQTYANSDDVVFGTTVSGRAMDLQGIENIVGLFINTVPLRFKIAANETISGLLRRIDGEMQTRLPHETASLADIKGYSEAGGSEELFDSIMVIENYPLEKGLIPQKSPIKIDSCSMVEKTHYDLTVQVSLFDTIKIDFHYNPSRLEADTVSRLARHFVRVIEEMTADPGKLTGHIDLLSQSDKQRILVEFNDTEVDYPKDKTIHGWFEEQAQRTPDRIAVTGGGDVTVTITYDQLNRRAGHVAHVLRKQGVQPDVIVAIATERSMETIIGILGILKSGGAYLPIDPGYPQERIDFMLQDSGAKVFVNTGLMVIKTKPGDAAELPIQQTIKPTNPAYVIYTSGSTGKPKGVVIEHRSVVNLLFTLHREYPFTGTDVYLFKTAYIFDVSVTELFGWYVGGGRLSILARGGERDPGVILDTIERENVTHINFVPSMFNAFVQSLSSRDIARLSTLKYIFAAGEALLPELVNKFLRLGTAVRLENIYGPTEATVYSSRYSLSHWRDSGCVPIGKPLDNVKLYILDRHDRFQPIGAVGELCIAGAGLARGYLNRPELTNEKFEVKTHSALYHTGDLARWLPDGNIEFLGRIDHQVKIRGYRVELGEIENRLMSHETVKEAVVIVKEDHGGETVICAYVVFRETASNGLDRLKDYLSQTLPGYMVPSYFVGLEEIPLNASGKILRRALPEPGIISAIEYIAPEGETEEKLTRIWSEVLGLEKETVGVGHNFFELGGHSLKATRIVTRIHRTFDIKFPLEEVFKNPTVRKLAACLHEHHQRQKETRRSPEAFVSIPAAEEKTHYPLSPAQKRLYVLHRMDDRSIVYNITSVMKLEGEVDAGKFEDIFKLLIRRHESLRTSFHLVNDEPVQRVHDHVEFKMEFLGRGAPPWSPLNGNNSGIYREGSHRGLPLREFVRPYDLSKAPLLRVGLASTGNGKSTSTLLVDMHHIIADGASLEILMDEWARLYSGEELSPLKVQYKDFTPWADHWTESETLKAQESYWFKRFSPVEGETAPLLNLPLDLPRPPVMTFEGDIHEFTLGVREAVEFKALAADNGATLYMNLTAAVNLLLYKYTGQADIIVGSVHAGRSHLDLDPVIGMFVNTLPIRNYPVGEKTYRQFLGEVKQSCIEAYENQDWQFEALVEKLDLTRDPGRNPLFDVCVVLQDFQHSQRRVKDLTLTPYPYRDNTAKFDLAFIAVEKEDEIHFDLEYYTGVFEARTIQRLSLHFIQVIRQVSANPRTRLADIDILGEEEKRQLLHVFNDTAVDYPRGQTIHDLYDQQTDRTPHHIAVVDNGTEDRRPVQVTYRELQRLSDCFAAYLQREHGIGPDQAVGVSMDKTVELMIVIVGILKAGGAYLPVNPSFPQERIGFMLRDSGVRVVVNTGWMENWLDGSGETTQQHINRQTAKPANLAYIMYTSGSTGNPKGVMVDHRNVVPLVINSNYIDFQPGQSVLQIGAIEFDASTVEIWGALLNGLTLYFAGKETLLTPEWLKGAIRRFRITTGFMTPAMFNRMVQEDPGIFAGMKYMLVGGDMLSPPHMNILIRSHPEVNLISGYGPTENTTFSTTFPIRREFDGSIPIGTPIANSTVFILDPYRHLQPVSIAGEIYVGGDGVARGYMNRPELTDEKFEKVDFALNSMLYRTGDLGRWLPEGIIEFLGRADTQVKIRGYRIELGEIESRLLRHELVKEAVVIAAGNNHNERWLCAYIVADGEKNNTVADELRDFLSHTLPDYMVPLAFVTLDGIPLTSNGKVNRKALPLPGVDPSAGEYTAPRDSTEKQLTAIWADILEIPAERTGIDGNFFSLGGHSLRATVLASRIHKTFGVKVPLAEIFRTPTIRELAVAIRESAAAHHTPVEPIEDREYYDTSSAQERFYILETMGDTRTTYNVPVVGTLRGPLDKPRFENAFRSLIQRHEGLRTSFRMISGKPVQVIHDSVDFHIRNLEPDTAIHPGREENREQLQPVTDSCITPFDLSCPPLLRVFLMPLAGENHLLICDMHHTISDGVSMSILTRELFRLYRGETLTPLSVRYRDFSRWQSRLFTSGRLEELEHYWVERFTVGHEPPSLDLPLDYPRPAIRSFAGDQELFYLESRLTEAAGHMVNRAGTTLVTGLLAAYYILLAQYSQQQDIVVGIPSAGRNHTDVHQMIGVFVNTLPVRSYPEGDKTFRQFLDQVKETTLGAYEHQDYPLVKLLDRLEISRDTARNPLFDVLFVSENFDLPRLEEEDLVFTQLKHTFHTSHADLVMFVAQEGETVEMILQYATALFTRPTIANMIRRYVRVLEQVVENEDILLKDIEIFTPEERPNLLTGLNAAGGGIPRVRGESPFIAPQTGLQTTIADIWKDILDKETVGADDNFFEIGGSSLGILKLKDQLETAIDKEIPDIKFLEYPTVRSLHDYLEDEILNTTGNNGITRYRDDDDDDDDNGNRQLRLRGRMLDDDEE
ncbi:MAG: amino acid adenylation domain-containing protein [bacterium]|nr:amino acid adenylation domain-containing protein [bacterium]